ncbi:MAG: hypothetical protein SPJ83_03235 [Helicobacter sp.]|nr:hypothetical protein [Helicobacter sp.]MDY5821802.1 hypothetical protein [Helicobacter sp.]
MATILEKEIKEIKRFQDDGKVLESTKTTTQTTIKKTAKKR